MIIFEDDIVNDAQSLACNHHRKMLLMISAAHSTTAGGEGPQLLRASRLLPAISHVYICLPPLEEEKGAFSVLSSNAHVGVALWQHLNWTPAVGLLWHVRSTHFSRVSEGKCRKGERDAGITGNNPHTGCDKLEENLDFSLMITCRQEEKYLKC